MKTVIVIPVTGKVLSQHFGHCEEFYFATVNDGKIYDEHMNIPPEHEPGLYPKWVREHGGTLVIAGGMGQKARDLFAGEGVEVVVGAPSKDPREVVEEYLAGSLVTAANTCNHK